MSEQISVVVPTKDRDDTLRSCLYSLLGQQYPAEDYEIIVADDAASEKTRKTVEDMVPGAGPAIRYVAVQGRHGPAAARNTGVKESRFPVLAFTDDDCLHAADWLSKGVSALTGEASAVCGKTIVPLPDTPSDYEKNAANLARSYFITANCFCRREAFDAIGGFDERFSIAWREDTDFFFRLLEHGGRVIKVDTALVFHPVRPAPWGVSVLQQKKALFNALLYKKHPELYKKGLREKFPHLYYWIVLFSAVAGFFLWQEQMLHAVVALGGWLTLTAFFCLRRLAGTLHTPQHILEMAVTSSLIPPLAVFWRLYGAVKYRVLFL